MDVITYPWLIHGLKLNHVSKRGPSSSYSSCLLQLQKLKTQSCHDANFIITGDTSWSSLWQPGCDNKVALQTNFFTSKWFLLWSWNITHMSHEIFYFLPEIGFHFLGPTPPCICSAHCLQSTQDCVEGWDLQTENPQGCGIIKYW